MSPFARFLLAALLPLGSFTMAAPTGTTTTITTTTTTTATTTTSHHLHAYLTTVASKLSFETATATLTHHPIMERRNNPYIRINKDGSLYSESNTNTTTIAHHNKKKRTDPLIKISKDGSSKPLSDTESYDFWASRRYQDSFTGYSEQQEHEDGHSDAGGRRNHPEGKGKSVAEDVGPYTKSRKCQVGKLGWCELRAEWDLIAGPGIAACTYFNFQKKELDRRFCQ